MSVRGTLVVTKVLGGFFVSSESVSYPCVRSKVRGHEVALLSLESYKAHFVFIPKILGDLLKTIIAISWY